MVRLFLRLFSARQLPGGLLFALLCAAMAGVGSVKAATLIVTTTADSGAGSLRDTIAAAGDNDTIQFDPALNGQTISLTSGELFIQRSITISGPGASLLTIMRDQEAPGFRIFHVQGTTTALIEGLTISGGYALIGGGIFNDNNAGTLTISDAAVTGNRVGNPTPQPSVTPTPNGFGGGIATGNGATIIRRSTISSNTATGMFGDGGGINGPVTITESIINNNHADGDGGGISSFPNNQGTITITNSTIDGNTAASEGGGIHIFGGLSVQNSTVRNNQASSGGGIYNTGFGVPVISNSTINNNTAGSGGGIFSGGVITNSTISGNTADWGAGVLVWFSQMTITNSTFAGNSSSQHGSSIYNRNVTRISNTILNTNPPFENIFSDAGSVASLGYNVCSDTGGGFLTGPGDQINTDPLLGPLQDNGGPTFTHGLLTGSPAIDAGDPNFTPPPDFDQRGSGFSRVFDGRIDIGSFELQTIAPTPTPTATASVSPPPTPSPTATASPTTTPIPTPTLTPTPTPTPTATATATATATPTPSPRPTSTPTPSATPARPLNLSTRLLVQTADRVGIGGFIITGPTPKQVLLRGIGPSLGAFGVPNPLVDPVMELHGPAGFITIVNDNWRDTQAALIMATGLAPTNDLESAILVTLAPRNYTAIVKGKNDTSGVGLVEVYDLGPAASKLANISTRAFVSTGANVMIGGFILGGGANAHIEIFGIGPSLAASGVSGVLADPTLELRDSNGGLLEFNDNCPGSPFHSLDPAEACIDVSLPPGAYTAILAGKNGGTGIGLVEIYDLN